MKKKGNQRKSTLKQMYLFGELKSTTVRVASESNCFLKLLVRCACVIPALVRRRKVITNSKSSSAMQALGESEANLC